MKKTKECLGSRNLFRADVENSLRIEDDIKCLSILFLPLLGVEAGGGRKSSWALSWKEESIRELCVCVLKARNLTINLLLLLAILHTPSHLDVVYITHARQPIKVSWATIYKMKGDSWTPKSSRALSSCKCFFFFFFFSPPHIN